PRGDPRGDEDPADRARHARVHAVPHRPAVRGRMEAQLLEAFLERTIDGDLALELGRVLELGFDARALVGPHLAVEVAHEVLGADPARHQGSSTFIASNASRSACRA